MSLLDPWLKVQSYTDVFAAPSVLSAVVPFASPDAAIAANFLGDDGQGHSSYSLAAGTASGAFTNTVPVDGTSKPHPPVAMCAHTNERPA